MSGVHLAEVPKAEPKPERRRLNLRKQQLDIELTRGERLEVALSGKPTADGLRYMRVFASEALSECRLYISHAETPTYCRLWVGSAAFAITLGETSQIRAAFPELSVREITEVGS